MATEPIGRLRTALLDDGLRTPRKKGEPRMVGATIILDKGLGLSAIRDLCKVSGSQCDYAKLAWGSALVTDCFDEKIQAYRESGVTPLLGGTLFEYAFLRGKTEELLAFVRDTKLHLEISDGCISLPRAEKFRWIERFAAHGTVFSEVGGKTSSHDLNWPEAVQEELNAGAHQVVIEGREVGPIGKEVRADLVAELVDAFGLEALFFEALERKQQVWLIKELGPNVNLGNILPGDLLTLESFRQGLKEHTLLHTFERQS